MKSFLKVTAEVLVPVGADVELSEQDLSRMENDICSDLANVFFEFETMEVKVSKHHDCPLDSSCKDQGCPFHYASEV